MNESKGLNSSVLMGIVLILVALGFIIYTIVGDTEDGSDVALVVTTANVEDSDRVIAEPSYPEGTYGELLANDTTEIAELSPVPEEAPLFGTAYRLFSDGNLSHAVTADLPAPGEGNQYEGWLVVPGTDTLISTGLMVLQDDTTWLLEFTAGQGYETYTAVVITEETVIDIVPEIHVLEGSF